MKSSAIYANVCMYLSVSKPDIYFEEYVFGYVVLKVILVELDSIQRLLIALVNALLDPLYQLVKL